MIHGGPSSRSRAATASRFSKLAVTTARAPAQAASACVPLVVVRMIAPSLHALRGEILRRIAQVESRQRLAAAFAGQKRLGILRLQREGLLHARHRLHAVRRHWPAPSTIVEVARMTSITTQAEARSCSAVKRTPLRGRDSKSSRSLIAVDQPR